MFGVSNGQLTAKDKQMLVELRDKKKFRKWKAEFNTSVNMIRTDSETIYHFMN